MRGYAKDRGREKTVLLIHYGKKSNLVLPNFFMRRGVHKEMRTRKII